MAGNIILLSIDALRADHLSCYGYNRDTTPNIDALAKDALFYKNVYSASSHTREAVPSILTGAPPSEAIDEEYRLATETIASRLPESFTTSAFHSNPFISRAYGFNEGFDHFFDDLKLGQNKLLALLQRALDKFVFNRGEYHARAERINDLSLEWIDALDGEDRFFLWNHYMDVHGPYNPPDSYNEWGERIESTQSQRLYNRLTSDEKIESADVERAINLYDGEIAYIDEQIGRFVSELTDRGLLESTLLVITSDHGDLFGEYGKHAHPRFVYPELTRVPLIIKPPSGGIEDISSTCSTMDIVPTILDWVGAESVRESLLRPHDLDKNRIVYSSARGENEEVHLQRFAAYQLEKSYWIEKEITTDEIRNEGYETNLLLGESVEPTNENWSELRNKVVEYSSRHEKSKRKSESNDTVDNEVERRLDALGYK